MAGKIITTLCIIHRPPFVLLGKKKRGFGAGKWNGFGGKVSPRETIEQAAHRELEEEAGVKAVELEKIGVLDFFFAHNSEVIRVHIFRAEDFQGPPRESEEMEPRWFKIEEIPFKEMWPDDVYWMPLFLERRRFTGNFHFDRDNRILRQSLKELNDIRSV